MVQSGDDVYIVTASYASPNMSTYVTNGISFITSLDFELARTVFRCTDVAYLEYDINATIDDNSCETLIVNGCTDLMLQIMILMQIHSTVHVNMI